MVKIFLDTEFIERPSTIELISIGVVAEDGRELYLENAEADLTYADDWIKTNVLAHLQGGTCRVSKLEMRQEILKFIGSDADGRWTKPEFWAYYADYDWVVFCWIFGRMIDLPPHFPMYCHDFKQTMDTFGIKKSDLPKQSGTEHHALADARWLAEAFKYTRSIHKTDGGGRAATGCPE